MSVRPTREPDWLFVPPLELPVADAGDAVYAAYSGRIAEVETNPAATRGNVTIDHHRRGLGFVSKYLHITDIAVAPGDFVQKGAPFARVSADPPEVRTQPDAEPAGGPLTPQSIGTLHLFRVPFFAATFPTDTPTVLHVPLYEPMTADERLTVDCCATPTRRTSP
jgi:hypothetical protein